jgi:drug/metabolite transporter (DMT)-like permease
MVEILALVLRHDEEAVLCAVELALEARVPTKTHVLNLLHRLPGVGMTMDVPRGPDVGEIMSTADFPASSTDRVLAGVALMLGFCLTAPLLDVAAKLASNSVPVGQITAARFVVQCALMAPFIRIMGLSLRVPRGQWFALVLRAVFLLASTFCFIAAIRVMPLADALAIVFVAPFIVLLVGKFYLGEDVGPRRVGAAIVGFVGVLFVIQPSFVAFGVVALFPLGTAVSFGAYILVTRGLSRRLHPVSLQFHTGLIASLLCLPVLVAAEGSGSTLLDPVWPQGVAWLWLLGVGFFATLSHMMMTYALSLAPSATLAPLQYLELPVATLLGYLVFRDFPNTLTLTGIAIIIGAGLYMIHRERITARRLVTERAAPPI